MPPTTVTATKKLLGEVLVELGIVSNEQIELALVKQKENHHEKLLGQILVEMGACTENDITRAIGAQLGMPFVDIEDMEIPPDVVEAISPSMAQAYNVIPIAREDGVLTVAMANPENIMALDDLKFLLGEPEIRGVVTTPEQVEAVYNKLYADKSESVESLIHQIQDEIPETAARSASATVTETIDFESISEMAESRPVKRLLNLVLLQAIKDRASDIHFEPFEDEYKIRYRIDGVLYEMVPPPKHLAMAIASRIKVMAGLDIAERRMPQDGRIELNVAGNPVDLRISVLPTMFGESVVMRVLDRSVVSLELENLGLRDDDIALFKRQIDKPNGIVLVTGPTGCGKTTTLYAALNYANDISIKIITTEDPVEYDLDGIVQVPINEEIGVTFAACLRSILRQDPDKVLVGEIRDWETAQIAVEASLTGHTVFSTLHTNDAPSTITRLLEMGVEPFLLTATLEAVVAQRLVRRICTDCREEYHPEETELMELALKPEDVKGKKFFYGRGCPTCNNMGFKGRMGIFEIMEINDDIRNLILDRASTERVRQEALKHGMRSLRDSGLLAIYDGLTTIEEVVKETVID